MQITRSGVDPDGMQEAHKATFDKLSPACRQLKVTINFAHKTNNLATIVLIVENMMGIHEYQGHEIYKFAFGGGPHYKAYELQLRDNAPRWRTSKEYDKNYIRSNYDTVKKNER